MAQAMVNFRMDEELKKNMEETCKDLGLSMTTAFTIFAKKMTREKEIRETLEKVLKINEGSSMNTPFVQFETTGGHINDLCVTVCPDGWHELDTTKTDTYIIFLDSFNDDEYKKLHEELDRLIREKEKTC